MGQGGGMKKFLVLNGVNLNMLGKRDPQQYGTLTLAEVDAQLHSLSQVRHQHQEHAFGFRDVDLDVGCGVPGL